MTQLHPYLNFNGQCREAMTFYQECLGGELVMQKVAESPMAAQMSSQEGANILHSHLTSGAITLMGSDMIGVRLQKGNAINLCLYCSSDEEINILFDKLSAGGQATMPPHQSFWGSTYGKLTDKYGITWLLNYVKN